MVRGTELLPACRRALLSVLCSISREGSACSSFLRPAEETAGGGEGCTITLPFPACEKDRSSTSKLRYFLTMSSLIRCKGTPDSSLGNVKRVASDLPIRRKPDDRSSNARLQSHQH